MRAGDKILCPNGHEVGEILVDLADGDEITPDMISLKLFEHVDVTGSHDGHFCKACGSRVTELNDGKYRVLTAQGWMGHDANT